MGPELRTEWEIRSYQTQPCTAVGHAACFLSIPGLSGISKHDSGRVWATCIPSFSMSSTNQHPVKKNDRSKRTLSHYFCKALPDPAHGPCNLEKNRRILIERKLLFCSIAISSSRVVSGVTLLSATMYVLPVLGKCHCVAKNNDYTIKNLKSRLHRFRLFADVPIRPLQNRFLKI